MSDHIIAAVNLMSYSIVISEVVSLGDRYRALVVAPNGDTVADFDWPSSPLKAALEARLEVLIHLGRPVYEVTLWGSRPGTNDDCNQGARFEFEAQARRVYADPWSFFTCGYSDNMSTAWFALERSTNDCDESSDYRVVEFIETRPNPDYDERGRRIRDRVDAESWRREYAMEAGMCLGVDAYNDAMGW